MKITALLLLALALMPKAGALAADGVGSADRAQFGGRSYVRLGNWARANEFTLRWLERDKALDEIIPFFEKHDIYSRGRFGLWKYEVSNQDHSFMQGVEVVERLMAGHPEVTARNPNLANSKRHPWPFEIWK